MCYYNNSSSSRRTSYDDYTSIIFKYEKIIKNNVLVRKLMGIETAGSLNILFSDKTGTITKGKLEVIEFIDGDFNSYYNIESISNELQN